jgi:fatty acid desaturase
MSQIEHVSTDVWARRPFGTETADADTGSDYARLLRVVRETGLLARSPRLYARRALGVGVLLVGGAALLVAAGDSWWQLPVAAYWAVVFAQLGFLGHDAGHQQVFPTRRNNDRLGLFLATVGIGLSYSWWIDKHNRHHRNPNEVGRDPDVDRSVLAWTPEQVRAQRGIRRLIARRQGLAFFPLLLLEALNLHVGSFRAVVRARPKELALLSAHVGIGALVLLVVMSPVRALVFVAVQQALFGLYLGCSFAPNHKGMAMPGAADGLDFLRRQVLTSRNVVGGPLTGTLLGGLNYQIEHHLFPSMPSRNLRRCQPIVRRFCRDNSVPYTEVGLFHSYRQSLAYLNSLPGESGNSAARADADRR